MGSGLIFAGIGKGISEAGATYGNAMFKATESELADQRALQKAQALEEFKQDLAEKAALRDADIYERAVKGAAEVGAAREQARTDADVSSMTANAQRMGGDSPVASPEEMQAALKQMTPENRKFLAGQGLISEAMSPVKAEMQRYEDIQSEAAKLGASSTLRKELRQAKSDRLSEIKQEFAEKKEDTRTEEQKRRDERLDREGRERADYQDRMAAAAETRANRPPSNAADPNKPATTADLQRQITAAQNSLAVELGVGKNDVNAEVASLKKKAAAGNAKAKQTLDSVQPYLDELKDASDRMLQFKRKPASAAKTGDNTGTRPPLSSFKR